MADSTDPKTDYSSEIQELVRNAKELEKNGELKECKHAYLDAASLSLKMSKTSNFVDKLSYENITKVLIQQAKDIQIEINLLKDGPLPAPPSSTPRPQQQAMKKTKKPYDPNEGLQFVQPDGQPVQPPAADKPEIHQLIAIAEGGLPILNYNFRDVSPNTTVKLNEILFSGAITAVNQLMQEVLERPIQTITFEDGILLIKAKEELYYVLFADEDSEVLSNTLDEFSTEFYREMNPLIMECMRTGMSLADDKEVIELIVKYFKN
ncbi:MAG: hypothetical protein ACXAD7_18805 [Candidatus Kariarchaeaceae archaeon]|jgi:hypothetical protein